MMRPLLDRSAVALVATFVLSLGCTHATTTAPSAPASSTFPAAMAEAKSLAAAAPATAVDGSDGLFAERHAGDFVVYKFSGSYRKAPLMLRERVVARDGGLFVLDYTMVDADGKGKKHAQTLRVHVNAGVGAKVEVLEVARVVDGKESAALGADFDAMMGKTILAVDDNEGTTAVESLTMDVGGESLACEKTSYRVTVGGAAAHMIVTQSQDFPWGDVAAEIVGGDGALLYRAEVVDAGNDAPEGAEAPAVAIDPAVGY